MEEFARVYTNLGYHFLLARVAHMGLQSQDAKLPALRTMLATRWGVQVMFETIPPQQDWMLCTVPLENGTTPSGKAAKILTTSMIHIMEGNASYVVQHLTPPL